MLYLIPHAYAQLSSSTVTTIVDGGIDSLTDILTAVLPGIVLFVAALMGFLWVWRFFRRQSGGGRSK